MNQTFPEPYFRSDIQGLRGIAVLLVVIYHSGSALPGGFIGVDVFFVISGFVITNLLIRERAHNQANILRRFYYRRVVRLLPAASIAVSATVIFSMFALAPNDELSATLSLARQSLYSANFFQLRGPGYFETAAPLQHMWSLAVEEQFYLVYPAIFLCSYWIFKRYRVLKIPLIATLVAVVITSFAFAELLARGKGSIFVGGSLNTSPQILSFFMMPFRAWEFAVGAAIAFMPSRLLKISPIFANLFCFIGFSAVIFSSFTFSNSTIFPGFSAAIPVLGTAFIIFGSQRASVVTLLLNQRPIQFIGNISYSWYLWHWPFIVFSGILFPHNSTATWVAISFSLLPSMFSYEFFEKSIKERFKLPSKSFAFVAIGLLLVLFVSIQGISAANPLLKRHSSDARSLYLEEDQIHLLGCADNNVIPLQDFCTITNSPGSQLVYLVGDSQAAAASEGVIRASKTAGLNIAIRTINGCPPLDFATMGGGCWLPNELDVKTLNPQIIIIASSLIYYAPETNPESEEIPASILSMINWVSRLESQGRKIIVLLEVPKMELSARATILQPKVSSSVTRIEDQLAHHYLESKFTEAFRDNTRVSVLTADGIFCPNGTCNPRRENVLLYRDPTHLSISGSLLLEQLFLEELNKLK
jgi:peptidoglycan/LPS O-acetylase OafA/YrhL